MSATFLPRAVHGRPRGFIEWTPHYSTAVLIQQVQSVLAEYQKHLPLTIRQIFYRLVGAHGYDKTERSYQKLGEVLNRARRARLIPFESIRDDGFSDGGDLGWEDLEHVADAIYRTARDYSINRQRGQPVRLALWCEASGMVPQLQRVAAPYSVPVYSSGGFDSVSVKHRMAKTFADMGDVKVLHIGDHDPSGVHVFGALDEDINAFMRGMGGHAEFQRLAVIPDHIERYSLPTAPPKASDHRAFTGQTVQAEALPPDVLTDLVIDAILASLDMEIYRQAVETEATERAALIQWLPETMP